MRRTHEENTIQSLKDLQHYCYEYGAKLLQYMKQQRDCISWQNEQIIEQQKIKDETVITLNEYKEKLYLDFFNPYYAYQIKYQKKEIERHDNYIDCCVHMRFRRENKLEELEQKYEQKRQKYIELSRSIEQIRKQMQHDTQSKEHNNEQTRQIEGTYVNTKTSTYYNNDNLSKTNTSKSKNTAIKKKDNENESEDLDGDLEKKEDVTNATYNAGEDKEAQKIKIQMNKSDNDQRNNITTDEPSKPEEVMNDKDEHKENEASIPDNGKIKSDKTESEKDETSNQDKNINNKKRDTSNPQNKETTNETSKEATNEVSSKHDQANNLNNTAEEEESNPNEEKLTTQDAHLNMNKR